MARIGTTRIQAPTEVYDVPVFEPVDNDERTALRVETDSGPGCIALADPAVAAFPALRVETANGVRAVTDEPTFTPADTKVEDFEIAPRYYSGDEYYFGRSTDRAWDGGWSLRLADPPESRASLTTLPKEDSPLEWFLPRGYGWVFRFRYDSNNTFPYFGHSFGKTTPDDENQYEVFGRLYTDTLAVAKNLDENYDQLGSVDFDFSINTWYQIRVDWYPDYTFRITLFDGQGNQLRQFSTSDTGATKFDGVGFGWFGYDLTGYWDALEVGTIL